MQTTRRVQVSIAGIAHMYIAQSSYPCRLVLSPEPRCTTNSIHRLCRCWTELERTYDHNVTVHTKMTS